MELRYGTANRSCFAGSDCCKTAALAGDVPAGLIRHPDGLDEANCWFGSSARKTGSQYTKTKVHEILDQDARRANGARTAPVHELQLINSKDLQIQSACIQ